MLAAMGKMWGKKVHAIYETVAYISATKFIAKLYQTLPDKVDGDNYGTGSVVCTASPCL